jgi:hypothetical protein
MTMNLSISLHFMSQEKIIQDLLTLLSFGSGLLSWACMIRMHFLPYSEVLYTKNLQPNDLCHMTGLSTKRVCLFVVFFFGFFIIIFVFMFLYSHNNNLRVTSSGQIMITRRIWYIEHGNRSVKTAGIAMSGGSMHQLQYKIKW